MDSGIKMVLCMHTCIIIFKDEDEAKKIEKCGMSNEEDFAGLLFF